MQGSAVLFDVLIGTWAKVVARTAFGMKAYRIVLVITHQGNGATIFLHGSYKLHYFFGMLASVNVIPYKDGLPVWVVKIPSF
jgi:hypothetical protein